MKYEHALNKNSSEIEASFISDEEKIKDLFITSKNSDATVDEKLAALQRLGTTDEQEKFEQALKKFNELTKNRLVRLNTVALENIFDLLSRTVNEKMLIPPISDDRKSFEQ